MFLTLLTFVPLAGIPFLWATKDVKTQRVIGIAASAVAMLLSIWLWLQFDPSETSLAIDGSTWGIEVPWIAVGESFRIHYAMNVDGISVLLVLLTGILGFVAALSAVGIKEDVRGFFAMYLLLLTGMFGTFVAMDLFLFYVFWEVMLLPMYFLIGIWGGPKREFAAIKFFLYTLVGSVLMLGAFLAVYFELGTFSIPEILSRHAEIFEGNAVLRMVLFVALFIGFAIKIPVFPFHTWLPLAHVEAPTPISVILAGVLLKMGGYGLMRMAYPWFPDAVVTAWPWLATLAVVSIVYGAMVALAQTDWKKLVAYSSVSHMGYVLLGLSAMQPESVNGAVLQMFNHGTISGMMFLCVGVLYDQAHHRDMNRFGGLLKQLPRYTFVAMIAFFGALGLPGLSGFVSEMMVFFGAFRSNLPDAKLFTILGTIGVVLGAAYILVMLQKVFLGKPREKPDHAFHDLSFREGATLLPLAAITIWLGVWPQTALNTIDAPVGRWIEPFAARIEGRDTGAAPVAPPTVPGDDGDGGDDGDDDGDGGK
jgi:NADH-quinone oxidoreductase subunit M